MNKVCKIKDGILGVEYDLVLSNAKSISKELKENFKSMGIDYKNFNSENSEEETYSWRKKSVDSVQSPPSEIYEYQNFFLLRKEDGKHILLDGFRRLLWYNCPDKEILIRVYDKKDLTDKQILKILTHLNHTKFFGGIGDYFDRGFSLALKSIFDIDILKYSNVLDAYLSQNQLLKEYGGWNREKDGEEKNEEILDRIVTDNFIYDMKFVQSLVGKNIMLNSKFGVLLWNMRKENPNFLFSAEDFLKKRNENKYIKENQERYKKVGDSASAEGQKVINRMIELYTNVFNDMLGKKVEKPYMELKEEAKELSKKLKKDKNLIKITDTKSAYVVEKELVDLVRKNGGMSPKISVVVYPYDESKAFADRNKEDVLKTGLYQDFFLKKVCISKSSLGQLNYDFLFVNQDESVKIRRNIVHHGFHSYSSNYDGVESNDFKSYSESKTRKQDADVFINKIDFFEDKKVFFDDKIKK